MSALTLDEARAEFAAAGLATCDLNGDGPGFVGLCPACPGQVTVTLDDAGSAVHTCSKCDGSRLADELHYRTSRVIAKHEHPPTSAPAQFTTRKLNAREFEPVRYAWQHRLVIGALNILGGAEGIGKGTLLAWAIGRLTTGEMPGYLFGRVARVLWIGDEDSWTQVVGPRLLAAGADLDQVEELTHPASRFYDVHDDAGDLDRIIQAGGFEIVVFEALLDNMPSNRGGDPMQHVRRSLAPTRAVLRRRNVTGLATMHARKGAATSFRELLAGSHQYNALSRSSLLLAVHPDDPDRRIVVAGKQNYSKAAPTVSFNLAGERFPLNGHEFNVPLASDFQIEEEITIDTLLAADRDAPVLDDLIADVQDALTAEPQQLKDIAGKVGRDPKDRSLRRALEALADDNIAAKAGRGLWQLKRTAAVA